MINYHKIYDAEYRSEDESHFLSELLPSGSCLEIGCGTGRILSLVERARTDIDFWGIDIDIPAIDIARGKCRNPSNILVQDATTYLKQSTFESIFFLFNGFMHLSREGQHSFLDKAHKNLTSGGILTLSISNPCIKRMSEPFAYYKFQKTIVVDGIDVDKFEFNKYDLTNQTIRRTFNYDFVDADGLLRRIQSKFEVVYLFKRELLSLLNHYGFEVLNVYGGFDKCDWTSDSDTTLVVARRA